jgi:hypothetical protein
LTVRRSSRQRPPTSGVSMSFHDVAPAGEPVWATSPTTVIERAGLRRSTIRHAIADSSWASSTMTWP